MAWPVFLKVLFYDPGNFTVCLTHKTRESLDLLHKNQKMGMVRHKYKVIDGYSIAFLIPSYDLQNLFFHKIGVEIELTIVTLEGNVCPTVIVKNVFPCS